ncbi:hypothetical protein MHK_003769 [Candidatus Magnetomorum sp. HK-1]|nr:hypothetical protein MHK_003769 [Candidatus Magnetomorum sp. HK-1]
MTYSSTSMKRFNPFQGILKLLVAAKLAASIGHFVEFQSLPGNSKIVGQNFDMQYFLILGFNPFQGILKLLVGHHNHLHIQFRYCFNPFQGILKLLEDNFIPDFESYFRFQSLPGNSKIVGKVMLLLLTSQQMICFNPFQGILKLLVYTYSV